MGVVWRGVHRRSGLPVALKLLQDDRAREPAAVAAFRHEVQAVAGLRHRHIVPPLDRGTVDAAAARASRGRWPEGAPWMAMELAAGGTLADRAARLGWSGARDVLLQLLSALAHAHAHGVLHRDIKPSNLLFAAVGPEEVMQLADFGVAHAAGQAGPDDDRVRGTPAYMAPEQFLGKPWLEGPWTDLYAVGCLAVELVTGRPPFPSPSVAEAAVAHRSSPVPPLAPRLAVPAGFEAWTAALLRKHPRERPAFASDAAAALEGLGPELQPPAGAPGAPSDVATLDADITLDQVPAPSPRVSARPSPVRFPPVRRAPPPPGDPPVPLRDAGLGLFGLRDVPFVGRESEGADLERALEEVGHQRRPRAVVVTGPSGTGKTRLAVRFGRACREAGAAELLVARHGGGAGDGLFAMFARHWRVAGRSRSAVAERMTRELEGDDDDAAAERALLLEALAPSGAPSGLRSRTLRDAVLRGRLAAVARDRPAVVVIDDAQWGIPAVDFVRRALADPEFPAVLFVVLVQDEARAASAVASARLAALEAAPGVRALALPPLGRDESEGLVRAMLGLDVPLVRRLAERTSGNPLFAVQLVADWVERGILEPGGGGLRLASGADTSLPADVATLFEAYVADVAGRGTGAAVALERAAVLGLRVDAEEWRAVGGPQEDGLIERLAGRRLVVLEPAGWSFVHGMLREALLAAAKAAGRLADHHSRCADVLAARGAAPERVGRHLLHAGRFSEACDPLLQGAVGRRVDGDDAACCAVLDDLEAALARGAAPDDPRVAEAIRIRAESLWTLGLLEAFRGHVARASAVVEAHGFPRLDAMLHLWRGYELERSGLARESIAEFREAERKAASTAAAGDLLSIVRTSLGAAYLNVGETAAADAVLAACRADLDEAKTPVAVCNLTNLRGLVAIRDGRFDAARAHILASLAIAEAHGIRPNVGLNRMNLGEIARMEGDLDAAEEHYRAAAAILGRLGGRNAIYPRLNLGLVQLERGDAPASREALEAVAEAFRKRELPAKEGVVRLFLLACVARLQDWGAWDEQLVLARRLLAGRSEVHKEVAEWTELAGDVAAAAGHSARARDAWAIAREQWAALGRPEDAARVEGRLGGRGGSG